MNFDLNLKHLSLAMFVLIALGAIACGKAPSDVGPVVATVAVISDKRETRPASSAQPPQTVANNLLASPGATSLPSTATTPVPSSIPLPKPSFTPTFTPTPAPTRTSTPTPPGKDGVVQGQGFYIQLTGYDFTPRDGQEDAAVVYSLKFVNQSEVNAEVTFSLAEISATDNKGTGYGDYIALAKRNWERNEGGICLSIMGQPGFPIGQRFDLPPGSSKDVGMRLNKNSTPKDCAKYGAGVSRVDIETDYLDLKLGAVKYRTDRLYELSNPYWSLTR